MLEKKAVDAAKSGVYFYIPSLSEVHKERLRRAGHSPRKRTKCGDMTFYSEMDIEFVREASDPSEVVLFEQGWTAFVALLLALPEEEFPKAKVLDLMAFKSALDLRRHPAENKADFIDCMFQKFPRKIGEWQSLAESNAALNNDILRDGHGPRATEAALSTMARSRLAKAAPSLGAAQVSQPQGASRLGCPSPSSRSSVGVLPVLRQERVGHLRVGRQEAPRETRPRCACACSTRTRPTRRARSPAATTFTSALVARAPPTLPVRAPTGTRPQPTACVTEFFAQANDHEAWLEGQRICLPWSPLQLRVCTSRPPILWLPWHPSQCLWIAPRPASLCLFAPALLPALMARSTGKAMEATLKMRWPLSCPRPPFSTRPRTAPSRLRGISLPPRVMSS